MYDDALFMVLVLAEIEKCREVHFLEKKGGEGWSGGWPRGREGLACRAALNFMFTSPSGGVKREHPPFCVLAIQRLAQIDGRPGLLLVCCFSGC